MYRWTADRDTRVSAAEVEQARAYLDRAGIATTPLEDGRFRLEQSGQAVEAAQLIFVGLRRVLARRAGHHG